MSVLIQFFFGIGVLANALWYYISFHWKAVFEYYYLVPMIGIAIGFIFLVKDTPMCLVTRYSA